MLRSCHPHVNAGSWGCTIGMSVCQFGRNLPSTTGRTRPTWPFPRENVVRIFGRRYQKCHCSRPCIATDSRTVHFLIYNTCSPLRLICNHQYVQTMTPSSRSHPSTNSDTKQNASKKWRTLDFPCFCFSIRSVDFPWFSILEKGASKG